MPPILLVVIGLVALGVGILIARWFARANPATVAKALRWTAIGVAFVVVAGLLLRLAPQFLPALLIFAVPFLIARFVRSRTRPSPSGNAGGPQAGSDQSSNVETAYLRMTLSHQTGEMSGEVRRGQFAGRQLSTMSKAELLSLRAECERDDPPSVRLVESYLDRAFGSDWRGAESAGEERPHEEEGDASGPTPGSDKMTRAEALEILGLEEGADQTAVLEAWRRLIKLNHPDHGGSKYIAAKLNQAKRVLLGK